MCQALAAFSSRCQLAWVRRPNNTQLLDTSHPPHLSSPYRPRLPFGSNCRIRGITDILHRARHPIHTTDDLPVQPLRRNHELAGPGWTFGPQGEGEGEEGLREGPAADEDGPQEGRSLAPPVYPRIQVRDDPCGCCVNQVCTIDSRACSLGFRETSAPLRIHVSNPMTQPTCPARRCCCCYCCCRRRPRRRHHRGPGGR